MRWSVLAFALLMGLGAGVATAADAPTAGNRLLLRGGGAHRRAVLVLRDERILPPATSPAGGGIIVAGGGGAGQCHVELPAPTEGWEATGDQADPEGWVYRGSRDGIIRYLAIRRGEIVFRAGAGWPCDASASQRLPVRVDVRLGERRYCSTFEKPRVNRGGRFISLASGRPTSCERTDVTAATLNILHGALGSGCQQTGNCRLVDRVGLFFDWVRARGCPDIVNLQEVSDAVAARVLERAADACPWPYNVVYRRATGVDDAIILSRYPVLESSEHPLVRNFRRVIVALVDHPVGPLYVFTTHLASSSDAATAPCGTTCPAACVAAGAETVRQCQGVQVARLVEAMHTSAAPALITGDFNEEPGSFVYRQFTERGWRDVYLAAGNPECDPQTGIGCTSGRADQDTSDLESPLLNQVERIDFIFLVPPAAPSLCTPALDSPDDADDDGTGTRLFAAQPNPFQSGCGPAPMPICWPSDHDGVEVDVDCGRSAGPGF